MSLVLRTARHTPGVLALMLLTGLVLACVTGELRGVEAARAKYDECVANYSVDDPTCKKLHKALQEAQRDYETKSHRGAWSCDPLSESCPSRY